MQQYCSMKCLQGYSDLKNHTFWEIPSCAQGVSCTLPLALSLQGTFSLPIVSLGNSLSTDTLGYDIPGSRKSQADRQLHLPWKNQM